MANLAKKSAPAAFVFPDKVLASHIGILGKAGSGKTVTAKGYCEALLDQKKRVCIVDPTGVWWGLKSSKDGKRAAFPVVIFGGEHADFPIGSNHGAAIAEIVGTTETSCILDTRLMTVGERTRFFTDFAETLLRKNKGPLHLVIDEAHVFAPQGRVNDPQSGKMLHATNNLVSLGRASGLRITMISQRPAKLHKDSLTQVETLIAMRCTAPQDRAAVQEWIAASVGKGEGQDIMNSLPALKTGTGWIWSPEIDLLEKVDFPMIQTYDSSKAPDDNERNSVVLAKIDQEGIQNKLETVAAEILNEDPKRLRARIAELERQAKAAPPPVDPKAIQDANDLGYDEGFAHGHEAGYDLAIERLKEHKNKYAGTGKRVVSQKPPVSTDKHVLLSELRDKIPPSPLMTKKNPNIVIDDKLSAGERKILSVIAAFGTVTKSKISIISGYSIKSSSFANYLSSLRSKGCAEGYGDTISITAAGRSALGDFDPLPAGKDLLEFWYQKLEKAPREILKALAGVYPRELSKAELSELSGYSLTSSSYANALSTLRSLELISGYQEMKANDDFFQ